ncbi:FecR family protein [Agriterribacter humi]|jgi:ferric-dicitrate binding protein FerR (iron transport regulator)|uniref:FecR family protein n=1 Tax=Agriterribacter humi TaxID=1104781 RepID=UPI0012640767|nr:FecR family protein [Agriterribacter humi]
MSISQIKSLLDRYIAGNVTSQEQKLVEQWLEENSQHNTEWQLMNNKDKAIWLLELYHDINDSITNKEAEEGNDSLIDPSLPWYKKFWLPVAAMLIVSIGTGIYYFLLPRHERTVPVSVTVPPLQNDALPGTNKAILTLDNGKTILLDDSQDGVLAKQGGTAVRKQGENLMYNAKGSADKPAPAVFNTLTTPRGGQYKLVLSDGSKVWLNASSSIRYPASFAGDERKVEITGEVYFEISHLTAETSKGKAAKRIPFKVKINTPGRNGAEVEVLGTHFNINAYDDEDAISTTLLEGSIKISPSKPKEKSLEAVIIKPGQQARLNKTGSLQLLKDVNLEETVAWKNGLFMMSSAAIPAVLRQLARWYDVDIVYDNGIPEGRITGDIPRDMNLSEVLKVMELSGVHFKIDNKKIIVNP